MKRSLALLIVVTMVFSLALVGCGSSGANDAAKSASSVAPEKTVAAEATAAAAPAFDPASFPITICMPMKIHPVHRIMETGFLSEAEALGYTNCTLTGIDDLTQPSYIAAIEAGITNGIKGMLVYAYDPYLYPTIKKIADAGIIVVTHHTPIAEGAAPGIAVNVGPDPIAYAKNAAKVLGESLAGKKGSVIVTQGSFNTAENAAEASFEEAMKAFPDIKVLKPQEEGFDAPKAIAKAVAIIQGNPDLIGVYGTTGGSAATWSQAKEQTKNSDLLVIGMDYTQENLDLIRTDKIFGVIAQPLFDETKTCMDLLDKILRGEKVPYRTNLDSPVVTTTNLADYDALLAKVTEKFK
jgi:ribose transport system substrate-binding protein